jgi:hypothetical protein
MDHPALFNKPKEILAGASGILRLELTALLEEHTHQTNHNPV